MAKNIETMALTAMAGMYGCELLNTTDEYTAPAGLGIAFVMPRDGAVIESYSYLNGVLSGNPPFSLVSDTAASWLGESLTANDTVSFHADRPCGKIKLTSGSVFVYFCDL